MGETQTAKGETPILLILIAKGKSCLLMSMEIGKRQEVDIFIRVGFLKMDEIQTAKGETPIDSDCQR